MWLINLYKKWRKESRRNQFIKLKEEFDPPYNEVM